MLLIWTSVRAYCLVQAEDQESAMKTPDMYSVGAATITRIEELLLRDFSLPKLFPSRGGERPDVARGDIVRAMDPATGNLLMSVHTWLIRDRGRIILVGTGVGNDKPRPFTPGFNQLREPFLERLAAAGVRPQDVNLVLLTHLHVDHVGWNTRLEGGTWQPTFPNAQYIFSGKEYRYFTDPANNSERNRTSFLVQQDSVKPIIDAGQARMIEIDGSEVIEGFRFLPTPGHTIDHGSIVLSNGGQTALFVGDLLHHPLQVSDPDLNSMFDAFFDQARVSRRDALEFAVKHEALVFSTHFPPTSAGRVLRTSEGFEWRFC